MSKLILMRGLPASGKSTRAAEIVQSSGNTVRVNRDLLRTMLHFDKWTGRNESVTKAAARSMVSDMLRFSNVNVIVDDTNLREEVFESWRRLVPPFIASVEVVDLRHVDPELCVVRDKDRPKPVGYAVILNMALQYGLKRFEPDSVVLCDIDGTIANIDHRLPFVRGEQKDWGKFFANIWNDSVREDVREHLNAFAQAGKTIIFLSARPERYRKQTVEWLERAQLAQQGYHPYLRKPGHFTLIMRREGDHRKDVEVKADMLRTYFPDKSDKSAIHAVVDDRPCVIRMWRELFGLNVLDVGAGVEF